MSVGRVGGGRGWLGWVDRLGGCGLRLKGFDEGWDGGAASVEDRRVVNHHILTLFPP